MSVVETTSGPVRGRREHAVTAFKGVPYAAPPVGERRLRPPVPPDAWRKVRDALEYGPTAPHPPYPPPFDRLLREPFIEGDDCLNLNLWTPDPGAAGLPVMVWIHGGAFTNGTGAIPTYDGTRFARDGVVLVTINYRLGTEGFLLLEGGEPNLGMQDQVAALTWVRDNIARFGGDPGNVTIFGESAGGMAVVTLLAMPSARGLFRRAVAQSGAGQRVHSPVEARAIAAELAERLRVPPTRDAFARLELETIFEAQVAMSLEARARTAANAAGTRGLPFAPCVDGKVLPGRPHDLVRAGAARDIDLLAGANLDEQNLWFVPTGLIDRVDEAWLAAAVSAAGLPVPETVAAYRAENPSASPGEILCGLLTDQAFRQPAIRLAEAQVAGGGRALLYEFAWRSPLHEGRLGAHHAAEIPFVFDNLDVSRPELRVSGAPQDLATLVHGGWVAFARDGDPGWPSYDLERRPVTVFDDTGVHFVDDPHGGLRRLWSRAEAAAPA